MSNDKEIRRELTAIYGLVSSMPIGENAILFDKIYNVLNSLNDSIYELSEEVRYAKEEIETHRIELYELNR